MTHTPSIRFKLKNMFGSVALRLALIFLVLIIIPLGLYIIFTYEDVYYKQIDDIYFNLFEEKREIESFYTNKQNSVQTLLTFFSELNSYYSETITPEVLYDLHHREGSIELRNIFDNVKNNFDLSLFFFMGYDIKERAWVSMYSTDIGLIGKSFNSQCQQIMDADSGALVAKGPIFGNAVLFPKYTVDISGKAEKSGYNIGVVTMPLLLKLLKKEIDNPLLLTDITLVDGKGNVFQSTNKELGSSVFSTADKGGHLKTYKAFNESYTLNLKKESYYAMVFPLIPHQLNAVLTIPHAIVLHLLREYYLKITVIFLSIFLLGCLLTLFLYFRMSRPLKVLCQTMLKVGEGDLSVKYKKDWWGCEINVVGEFFNGMIKSLLDYLEKNKELALGRKIQETILPQKSPDIPFFDTAFMFKPAHELGGDVFDFFFIQRWDKHLFFIGDTSGKGVDASLYSLTFRAILKTVFESAGQFSDAVIEANSLFKMDTKETGFFVTAWIGMFDQKTKQLEFICCGHNPVFLNRDNALISLPEETVLPAIGAADYTEAMVKMSLQKIELKADDTLFLYTDGVTDANNPKEEMFGVQRIKHILQTIPFHNSQDLIDQLYAQVVQFVDGQEQFDDITMICIKVKGE